MKETNHARQCSANFSKSASKIPEGVADLVRLEGGGIGLIFFSPAAVPRFDGDVDGLASGMMRPRGDVGGEVGVPVRS